MIDLQYYADMMRAAAELKVVYITMKQKALRSGTAVRYALQEWTVMQNEKED